MLYLHISVYVCIQLMRHTDRYVTVLSRRTSVPNMPTYCPPLT